MVRYDKTPLNVDPTGYHIGFPDESLAAGVPMLKLLSPSIRELYSGMGALRTPDADSLSKIERCLMVLW